MKKKILGIIGGGTALAAVFGAAVWGVYPENQERALAFIEQAKVTAGLSEPAAQPEKPFRYQYVGYGDGAARFSPDRIVESCGADNKIMRLSYGLAIIADARKDDVMREPRVLNNEARYDLLRRDQINRFLQAKWTEDATTVFGDGAKLDAWLERQVKGLEDTLGVRVAFRVNPYSAMASTQARADAIDACTPAGTVPTPLTPN